MESASSVIRVMGTRRWLSYGSYRPIRQVIHRFNEMGTASLNRWWAGGRPRLINPDDEQLIVTTADTRPEALG